MRLALPAFLFSLPPQFLAIFHFFLMSLMNSCIKALDNHAPLSLIFCSRFAIGLMLLSPLIYKRGGLRRTLKTSHPYRQVYRACLSMLGVGLLYYALPLLPLGDGMALWQTQAFFLLIFSGFVTSEKINPKYFLTCGFGFLGVLLIIHPQGDTDIIPALIMIASAAITAFTTLTIRFIARKDDEITIMTWFFCLAGAASLVWYLFFSPHPALVLRDILLILCAGIFGSLSQLSMTKAFKALGADAIGPYTYSGIVFSTIMGILFFSEIPTWWMLGGTICIMLAIHWNHRLTKHLLKLSQRNSV